MPLATSIVLCTCNGARFLAAQWDSLLAQSRRPDEIVVRDDASSDATPVLLETLSVRAADAGVRVRLTRNPANLGYVANFSAALRDASGDVLFLCDQDDVWHADKLAVLAEQFEQRPDLLLMCTDARRMDAAGVALRRSLFEVLKVTRRELDALHAGDGFRVLLRRSLATGATVALRRSLLDAALPVPAGWVHDEWLAIMAAALGGVDCVKQPLIDYRQHDGNQLGMPARGLAVRWHGLVKPPPDPVAARIAREAALRGRLCAVGGRVFQTSMSLLDEKLCHLRARGALSEASWRRPGIVLRELLGGRYRRYGAGWHSALRDLLRRD
jgi:hypothetical protein